MNKELEALESIRKTIQQLDYGFVSKEDEEDFQIIETALKDYEKLTNNNVRFTSKYDVEKLVEDYGKLKDEYDRLESIHTDFIKQYNLLMKDHSKVLKALEIIKNNFKLVGNCLHAKNSYAEYWVFVKEIEDEEELEAWKEVLL